MEISSWIINNSIEIAAAFLGILYIFLSITRNIFLWPIGLLTSAMYVYVFFISKFYADMGLQVYYVIISIYGWYLWLNGRQGTEKKNPTVIRASRKLIIVLLFITIAQFFVIGYILDYYTDSSIPYWDALTTSASITATWMLARKIIDHWIVWVIVDIISLGLYVYKQLYPTAILFVVYTVMAVIGYIEWKKELEKSVQPVLSE